MNIIYFLRKILKSKVSIKNLLQIFTLLYSFFAIDPPNASHATPIDDIITPAFLQ